VKNVLGVVMEYVSCDLCEALTVGNFQQPVRRREQQGKGVAYYMVRISLHCNLISRKSSYVAAVVSPR